MLPLIETDDEKACWREGAIIAAVICVVLLVLALATTGVGFVVTVLLLILWALLTYFFAMRCLEKKTAVGGTAFVSPPPERSSVAGPAEASTPERAPAPAPEPEPEPAAPQPVMSAAPAAPRADGPELLAAPRDGAPDDLKRLKGVGPKLENVLHSMGIYHFDQIAAWTAADIAWVDDRLSFKGRIERDGWVAQAKELAAEKGN